MVWTDGQSIYPNDFAYHPDSDTFNAYDYREREGLNRLAETGIMVSVSFPDRSSLFVHRDLDADLLAKRFWQERQEKRTNHTIETLKDYLPGILLPPLGVLLFGLIVAWIINGFRRDPLA